MSEIYCKLLSGVEYGRAIWTPEPDENLPIVYREQGGSIGDVGYFTSDGGFAYLFNACLPITHSVHNNGVPDGFVPIILNEKDIVTEALRHPAGTVIASAGLQGGTFTDIKGDVGVLNVPRKINQKAVLHTANDTRFSWDTEKGAFLILPEGASRDDLVDAGKLLAHANAHITKWWKFATDRGASTSLFVVTGLDKTSSWSLGSFSGSSKNSLSGSGGGLSYSLQMSYDGCVQTRVGPTPRSNIANQCVFLRGQHISLQGQRGNHLNPPIADCVRNNTGSFFDHLLNETNAFKSMGVSHWKAIAADRIVQKRGEFTDIYHGDRLADISSFVIKLVKCDPKDAVIRQKVLSTLVNEKDKWSFIHPIIRPIRSLYSPATAIPAVQTPWYKNGNVIDFIRQNPVVNKLALVLQFARAVEYIHSKDIIHGNIVPSNVMVTHDESPCLSDVNLDAYLSKVMYSTTWPIPLGWMYKAPEELLYEYDPVSFAYTKAMDVYTFANTVHMIYTLKPPFHALQSCGRGIMKIISHGHVLEKPAEIMGPLWDLLQLCRSYHPEDRPSMGVVVAGLEKM